MKFKRTVLSLIFISSIFFVILMIINIPMKTALVFYEKKTDRIAAYLPVNIGDTFEIVFTHSIHLTDVVEKYEILENGDIKQFEMVFEEFGIGMPSTIEEHEEYVYEDRKHHIKNMNNIFPSMNIRNGKTVSEHRLVWYNNEEKKMTQFNNYFLPGDWFTVKIDKLSPIQTWKEVKIHE